MAPEASELYLADVIRSFKGLKKLADRAAAQVSDRAFFVEIDPESNSLAVIYKHMGGNLRSRWTDFLTTDGEKPDRDRDAEFLIEPGTSREAIVDVWERGWGILLDSLAGLGPDHLPQTVMIRSEPHTVLQAIDRSLTHAAYHVGQIVFLSRHLAEGRWQSLSIPRGESARFNARLKERFAPEP
jgi:hypothetical protein